MVHPQLTLDKKRILEMLEQLKQEELNTFKWHLHNSDIEAGFPCIPKCKLEKTNMLELVDLIIQTYWEKTVEITTRVFKKMKRNDLVKILSDSSVSTGELWNKTTKHFLIFLVPFFSQGEV